MNDRFYFSCSDYDFEMIQHATRVTCIFTPYACHPFIHVYDLLDDDFSFPGNKKEIDEFINNNFYIKL